MVISTEDIERMYSEDQMSIRDIAKKVGRRTSTISEILRDL